MENIYFHKNVHVRFYAIAVCMAGLLLLAGCHKQNTGDVADPGAKTIDQLKIAAAFNWATTHNVDISIAAKDNLDSPVEGVRFTVYTANPDSGGFYLVSGITGSDGMLNTVASIPVQMSKVTVFNNFLGLIRQMELPVTASGISGQFGGKSPLHVNMKSGGEDAIQSPDAVKWVYLSTFNTLGVPNNLMPVNDPVSQTLLHDINTALPEYKNETAAHPEYFTAAVPKNIDIVSTSDVYMTYITEGAGWMNSLGYFKYNTAQPPASASQIDTIHVIFPNLSNTGSGGGLNPGNKVHLGIFPAGKSIGWVLVPHGWNGKGTYVGPTSDIWYSITAFNTTDPTMTNHMIQLKDVSRQQVLYAFEDQGAYQGSDHDFNDGVMYLTINPLSSANITNMPSIATTVIDQDHDGVPDNSDDYPLDPARAFNNYSPSKTGYSSLVFEDLWPGKGDYDFNDLVLSYRFNRITNAQNMVVEIDATLIPEAIGAAYHNGFGFQMPVTPDKILNVTGYSLNHGYVTLSANHTEAGQAKAVIVPFDDAFDILHAAGQGQTGANTEPGKTYVIPDTLKLVILLATPVTLAQAGIPPFNPFLIVNGIRNREVHLPDQPPTDKADISLLGTDNDDSKPSQGRYYKTVNNLPWAMNIADKFGYPIEKAAINTGYLKFNSWAESSGISYPGWYGNQQGYRQASKIFSH
ncbi:MAG: LruC domain-containing protein [Bacteroidota bacterium]